MKIWTEISEERLVGNFAALQQILFERQGVDRIAAITLLAVVKANAYGHGIDPCAAILTAAGAEWLGVTDAHEGARVRAALTAAGSAPKEPAYKDRDGRHPRHPEILVMSGTAELEGEAECIVQNGLTAVVWTEGQVARLAEAAFAAGVQAPVQVHLEVDTGMSRQGVAVGPALDAVLRTISEEQRLSLNGVFTHFASTEVAGSAQTAAQERCFEVAIARIAASGLNPQWVHVGNSSFIDNEHAGCDSLRWLQSVAGRLGARAMVRSGLALYGYLLPIEGPGRSSATAKLLPVMTWKTRVIGIREVPTGALVGYNGTFTAESPRRLALLPAGYADGLRRELSSTNTEPGGWVIVRGMRAPIVGRVSMNLTTVDVTRIAGAMEGDEVVLLGDGVSAKDHAGWAGTIPYEILCGVRTSQ